MGSEDRDSYKDKADLVKNIGKEVKYVTSSTSNIQKKFGGR